MFLWQNIPRSHRIFATPPRWTDAPVSMRFLFCYNHLWNKYIVTRIIQHYGHKTLWTVSVEVCKNRVCGYSFLVVTGVSLCVSIQSFRCWSQISFHNRRWKCSICFGTVSNWCFRTKLFNIFNISLLGVRIYWTCMILHFMKLLQTTTSCLGNFLNFH